MVALIQQSLLLPGNKDESTLHLGVRESRVAWMFQVHSTHGVGRHCWALPGLLVQSFGPGSSLVNSCFFFTKHSPLHFISFYSKLSRQFYNSLFRSSERVERSWDAKKRGPCGQRRLFCCKVSIKADVITWKKWDAWSYSKIWYKFRFFTGVCYYY